MQFCTGESRIVVILPRWEYEIRLFVLLDYHLRLKFQPFISEDAFKMQFKGRPGTGFSPVRHAVGVFYEFIHRRESIFDVRHDIVFFLLKFPESTDTVGGKIPFVDSRVNGFSPAPEIRCNLIYGQPARFYHDPFLLSFDHQDSSCCNITCAGYIFKAI